MGKLLQLLGPRTLKNTQNDGFLLSTPEWLTIQVYVKTALALPITEQSMRDMLLLEKNDSIEPYAKLIKAYRDIHDHCKVWDDKTFPESVTLASDIVQYSRQAASYYRSMLPHAQKLAINPSDETARRSLVTTFKRLAGDAKKRSDHAQDVATAVSSFASQTESDQRVVQGGPDGGGGLYKHYFDTHSATSAEGRALAAQLTQARQLLSEASDEYTHDVIVAATTPTYATVPIFGWVAAPVVAGIYTKKALDALEAMDRARREIGRLETTIRRNMKVMQEMEGAKKSLFDVKEAMNPAVQNILKIRGAWEAIASDLSNFVDNLDDNLRESVTSQPDMIEPDIEVAIDTWKDLGKAADKYRTNAYVQVVPAKAA